MLATVRIRNKLFLEKLIRRPKFLNESSILQYSNSVRVRFAPSPTGFLHLGGLRTALYNYLFAKSQGGKFILRIEDTDAVRTISGSIQEIENDLSWLSITPDESPGCGGPFGPYMQSERIQLYKEQSEVLVQNGSAYKCFCSKERLTSLRKTSFSYDNKCRSLTPTQIRKLTEEGTPFCIRLKMQAEVEPLNDLVYGERTLHLCDNEGDPVIMKTSGMPTYHMANVIDDHFMEITHVLRGYHWLSSTQMHLQLYKALKWELPLFGHLPHIVNLDGTKLSKREESLHVRELRHQGFSPEAVLNFTKMSGGGFEDIDHEKLCSLPELIQNFRLDRIVTHESQFDFERLKYYGRLDFQKKISNKKVLSLTVAKLKKLVLNNYSTNLDVDVTDSYLEKVVLWGQKRVYTLNDFTSSDFQFLWVHPNQLSSRDMDELKLDSKNILHDIINSLNEIELSNFTCEAVSAVIKSIQKKHNVKTPSIMKLLRISISGSKVGPPVAEVFALIGKETCFHRLNQAHLLLL